MRTVLSSTRVAVLSATAALLGGTVLATSAAASVPGSRAAPAGGPGHWSQVTANGMENFADIGLARGARGALNVIWASNYLSTNHAGIMDTPISAGGAVGHPATIVSGQFTVTFPDAAITGAKITAVWNGIASGAPGSPEGTFLATRSGAGGHWSGPVNIPPIPAVPDISSADSATTGADGKPWVAFDGSFSLTVDHVGQPERELPPSACCVYFPGLAVDGVGGGTWIAYQSLITKHEGLYEQRLNQNGTPAGRAVLLPGSRTHGLTAIVNERIAVTGRGHGRSGVYAVYETGYPFATGIDLLRLGGGRPVRLARTSDAHQFAGAAVTADPKGGLWAAWFSGDGSPASLFVRQSSNSIRRWGRAVRVRLPSGTSIVWKVYISAQASRLDVVALLTRHGKTAFWATQVR